MTTPARPVRNPLLDQFLTESADLLTQVEEGLLDLEREPHAPDIINEVFRVAHTLKGSSGLFDLPELTQLTHAAEDLLDAARAELVAFDSAMIDDLLVAFDLIRGWLVHVDATERLPPEAMAEASAVIDRLRSPLGAPGVVTAATRVAAGSAGERGATISERSPDWLWLLGEEWLRSTVSWLDTTGSTLRCARYAPDEGCFFRGEDPLYLVGQVPAVDQIAVVLPDRWPTTDDYDEYACLLGFVVSSRAGLGELGYLFRYVAEQVEVVEVDAASLGRLLAGDATDHPAPPCQAEAAVLAMDLPLPATPDALGPAVRGPLAEPAHPAVAVAPADGARIGARTLKVDQDKIDTMMELVGELNVAKNGLVFLASAAEGEYGSRALSRRIKDQHAALHRITEELRSSVMGIRMLPLSVAFRRVPRLLRDLTRRLGKSVELLTDGDDTTADKDIIEALSDPLLHLVRNCVDHGIEPPQERALAGKPVRAVIRLTAMADNDAVVIEVSDDGRGIDPDLVRRKAREKGLISAAELAQLSDTDAANLVFLPGFSTANEISEVSGRGVGMDVVRTSVVRLGGSVSVRSRFGEGTVVRLRLPLSMAISKVMVIGVAGQRFGVPLDVIVETTRAGEQNVARTLHQDVLLLRDEVIPLVDLADALGMDRAGRQAVDVLVVMDAGRKVGLLVERLHREADVLLKPMDGLLAEASVYSGTALLGDGLVLLVLDVGEVLGHDARVG